MHDLARLMAERIAEGLKRKSLTKCSKWAENCRVMGMPFPGPWSFTYHPWLKDMHDSECEMNVGQKSAQMGYTETALNITFFLIDIRGIDCLYVLPSSHPDASDFSAARFGPALELSSYLSKLFSNVDNIGHKRAGTTNLYVRGSKSRSGLKSIPVGGLILDEVDEMDQDNVPLALERQAGQMERMTWAISTPTIPNFGINKMFNMSTQEHYYFKCPSCSRYTELIFPQCLEITAEHVNDPRIDETFIKCKECKAKLHHETKRHWLQGGRWEASFANRLSRGFWVNQLYSSTIKPANLALSYLKSLRDPAEEQEFYNSKLGLPHIVEGAGVTDADLDKCTGEYKRYNSWDKSSIVTMGVDVGRHLHYEINQWSIPPGVTSVDLNVQSKPRVLDHGKLDHFEELDKKMRDFGIMACVIDANPERRKAYEFACRFPVHVKLCFYGQGIQGKQIHVGKDAEPTITVDRTSWLDLSLGRFRNGTITIPADSSVEYRSHMKSLVRIYEKDKNGNPVGRYVKGSDEDHYAHARNYSELALPFALGMGQAEDMENIL